MRVTLSTLALTLLVAACSGSNGGGNGDGDTDSSTHCTPLTPEGICNVFEQCGCPSDAWCGLRFDNLTCTFFEDCYWASPGEVGVEGRCYSRFDGNNLGECRLGMDCFWVEEMYSERCHQFCLSDEDCTVEGRTCSKTLTHADLFGCTTPVELPFMACNMSF